MKKIITISIILFWVTNIFAQQIIPVVQTGHSGKINHVKWDETGRYIASADANNDVVINDVIAGKQFYKIKLPGKAGISDLKFVGENLIIENQAEYYAFNMQNLELSKNAQSFLNQNLTDGYQLRGGAVKKKGRSLINKDVFVHFTCVASHPTLPFVIAGDEKGWIYFCNKSLRLKKRFRTHQLDITSIDFTKDGKFAAIASADRSISIWSLPEIKFEKRLIPRSFNVYGMDSHPSGNVLAFGDELGFTYLMTFENDKITCEGIDTHNGKVNDVVFTPNQMCVATAGSDNRAAIVDFENMRPLQYFTLHPSTSKVSQTFNVKAIQDRATDREATKLLFDENVYSVAVSPDGTQIAYSGGTWGKPNPMMKVASIKKLNLNKTKAYRKKKGDAQGLSKKNNTHIFHQLYFDDEKQFWGLGENYDEAQAFKVTLTGYDETTTGSVKGGFAYSDFDENKMIIVDKQEKNMNTDYLVKRDMRTGDMFSCSGFNITKTSDGNTVSFEGHRGYINDIEMIREKNFLVSSAEDASMIFWNLETGEKIMIVYVVDQGKLVLVTPENYYMAQGDALTGLGFNYNGRVLPAEQFDLKYNRPDIVMDKMGVYSPDIITLYHKAYVKRLRKSGFTEEMLEGEMNLPELTITNLNDISYKTKNQNLNLNITMSDDLYEIDRLNIWVNDVPFYGTRGLSLKEMQQKTFEKSIDLPLSVGMNLIQVSCLNSVGIESLKEEFEVEYESNSKQKPDLYLVSVAVAEY
ncbi:MAG: hypothetical protein GX879_05440, partial [Bacteroidales bacterium]|nr:hypothetical protein [Bacteroidales bacterium]